MQLRKVILFFLSLLPIPSISFAVEYEDALGKSISEKHFNLEGEMLRRLDSGNMSDDYYDFLNKYKIKSIEELTSSSRTPHRRRMLDRFINDLRGNEVSAGTISEIIEK